MPNLNEKIKDLKDRLADIRDYISSDFCEQCIEMYRQKDKLLDELKVLENERDRQS